MGLLKQAVAAVVSFPMVSSTDHVSVLTGATVTVNISKAGAAFGAAAGAVAEIANGWYKCSLTTADTGTLGDLAFHCTATGGDPTQFKEQVVAFDPTDAVALGLSRVDAAVSTRATPAQVLATPANLLATDGTGRVTVGTNADKTGYTASTVSDKTGYSLSAAGVQAIWDALTSALTTVGSIGARLATNIDAAISSRLATSGYTAPPTAAAVSTQVWTEPIPGTFAAGSAGAKLNAAGAAGDPWATLVPAAYGAGTAGNKLGNLSGASGSGANQVVVTVQNDASHPVAGAQFWVTTDAAGSNIVASGTTDTFGKVTVFLNNGTFWGWAAKAGENFTSNPLVMVVP